MPSCTLLTAAVGTEQSWQQATSHHVYLLYPHPHVEEMRKLLGTWPILSPCLLPCSTPLTSSLLLFDARMQYMIAYNETVATALFLGHSFWAQNLCSAEVTLHSHLDSNLSWSRCSWTVLKLSLKRDKKIIYFKNGLFWASWSDPCSFLVMLDGTSAKS